MFWPALVHEDVDPFAVARRLLEEDDPRLPPAHDVGGD